MNRYRTTVTCGVAALAALLGACSDSSDYVYVEPATLVEEGPDAWRIDLTASAAERAGITTTGVEAATGEDAERLQIPYSAVIYHFDGSTWTYTTSSELSYSRAAIEIDRIEGDRAILTSGPPVGSQVVTVGAAELYGVEFGIGK